MSILVFNYMGFVVVSVVGLFIKILTILPWHIYLLIASYLVVVSCALYFNINSKKIYKKRLRSIKKARKWSKKRKVAMLESYIDLERSEAYKLFFIALVILFCVFRYKS
jgi:hypothetical protein